MVERGELIYWICDEERMVGERGDPDGWECDGEQRLEPVRRAQKR